MTETTEPQRVGDLVGDATPRFLNSKICIYCKQPLPEGETVPICDACDAEVAAKREHEAEEARMAARARRSEQWAKIRPAGIRATVATDVARELIKRWQPGLRFGATILGATGEGKEVLWAILEKAWRDRVRFEHHQATEMRGKIMSLARNGDTAPAIRALVHVPLLAITDFGVANPTAAGDELWSTVLGGRASAGRPTIIQTPFLGKELVGRFSDPTCGKAILESITQKHAWVFDTVLDEIRTPTS